MHNTERYHLNGEEPDLVGQCCTGFALQHFYENQQITDQVNVAYLRFSEQWYRLYFECATIFWRISEPPEASENSSLAHGLLLNDLSGMESVVGQTVQAVAYAVSESGDVRATIMFINGKNLVFEHNCEADSTRFAMTPTPREQPEMKIDWIAVNRAAHQISLDHGRGGYLYAEKLAARAKEESRLEDYEFWMAVAATIRPRDVKPNNALGPQH